MAALSIAFEKPDNYRGAPSHNTPIDLVHLARQTSGDQSLELEVLHAFARQARNCMAELSSGTPDVVIQAAHRLRGAAEAVGAFTVSKAAGRMEENASDSEGLANLAAAVIEAETFILKLSR